jgi:hypothetical protein
MGTCKITKENRKVKSSRADPPVPALPARIGAVPSPIGPAKMV